MSAAAVLRSACRGLRRPSSFPRTLVTNEQPFLPREIITPHRLYSCDVNKNKPPHADCHFVERHRDPNGSLRNSGPAKLIVPKKLEGRLLKKHVFLTIDEVNSILDRTTLATQLLLEEKNKRDRGRRRLLVGSIFVGLAIYVKQHFFRGSDE